MTKTITKFTTVDEYAAALPDDARAMLNSVREAIKADVPGVEEVISYQIPAFRYKGYLLYFSAHKNHYSLTIPHPKSTFEVFQAELSGYEISKSLVKFPKGSPVPIALIAEIARRRAGLES